ncbi:5-beta-cholestane-3-alpha,7-alpha-diol 12-alpha-hydroxylase-like [Polypterus senegalus]
MTTGAMALALPLLLGIVVLTLSVLFYLGAFRQRKPGEPPLDRGPVPWLGHVLEFRRDMAKFLRRMQKRHGDVFTVQLAGHYFTFIMDPLSFGAVVKEARSKLDFSKFARQLVRNVFGYHSMPEEHKFLETTSNKHLMGQGLAVMTQAMMRNLQNLMLHRLESGGADREQWCHAGLFDFCYSIAFRAGYLSLFGNENLDSAGTEGKAKEMDRHRAQEIFQEFRKYDQLFPRLAFGVLPPKDKAEAERLKRFFWRALAVSRIRQRDNVSGWVSDNVRMRTESGMKEFMQDRYMLGLLWVSQGNTGPSAFWLLLFLMKHPEAMAAVRGEVDRVLTEAGQRVVPGGPLIDLTKNMLLQTPVLDSAVEEMLRMTAAPMLTRAVLQDVTLKMAGGKEYHIRRGDRVALFPHASVQMDPAVHADPHVFRYDRFLTPEGSRKVDFHKDGQKLKFYNMPWGAGATMCPGRFFATNELKQFVFLMLSYFDFELLEPAEETPGIDVTRWGFGTMQPTREVQFKYRLRV